MNHEQILAERCVAAARSRAGAGWSLLGPDLQEALVAKEELSQLFSAMLFSTDMRDFQAHARAVHAAALSLLSKERT